MKTTTITIKGTHCNACKMLIEDVAKDVQGIHSCTVDFATGKTDVQHENNADLENFAKEVETLGRYKVMLSH